MIKILFLKEEPKSNLVDKIEEVIKKFGILDKEYPNEYRKSEINYQVVYDDSIFFIGVSIRTFNNISSVIVELYEPADIDIKCDKISEFKRDIKSEMMQIMDKCYWIEDDQMVAFSKEAYENINKAENMFRSFMLNYMIHTYGGNWIESISKELKGNITEKFRAYRDSLIDLKDVNLDLYSLYINDLNNLVENEYKVESNIMIKTRNELDVNDKNEYKDIVKFIKKNSSTIPEKSIKITGVEKTMFWDQSIGKYVSDKLEFKNKWLRVCKNRNHVAHNKPIDKNMYNIINSDTRYVIREIEMAIKKLYSSIQTEEDEAYFNEHDKAIRSIDLETYGAIIYSKDSIEEKLDEYFERYKLYLEDLIYFNDNFNYTVAPFLLEKDSIIIQIESRVTGDKLMVTVEDYWIDDSDGGQSEVNLAVNYNSIKESGSIIIENAQSEFDENTGTYIPYTYESIDDRALFDYTDEGEEDKIIRSIREFIDNQQNSDLLEDACGCDDEVPF